MKTEAEKEKFLLPDYERDLYNPMLLPDMERAVERIFSAITTGEKIAGLALKPIEKLIKGGFGVAGATPVGAGFYTASKAPYFSEFAP